LHAVASDPPQLSFRYDEIVDRVKNLCVKEQPVGSSLTGSCQQMKNIAAEKHPNERVLDWDEQKLDIPDPYLVFYLRWSGFINHLEAMASSLSANPPLPNLSP
jgi:hypothetical protein